MCEVVHFLTDNIVNHDADGLISTGNVYLNMSGGVNGELLSQGGIAMQKQLHGWLVLQKKKFVQPGFVMEIGPDPFAFKCIVYTVAVDAFYDSSVSRVVLCLQRAFEILYAKGCQSMAVPAMATGYGRLSRHDFGVALRQCLEQGGVWDFTRIDVVCERGTDNIESGFHRIPWVPSTVTGISEATYITDVTQSTFYMCRVWIWTKQTMTCI